MEQKEIAKRILERRKALGLTQEQLGERLNVTGQAVSKWETAAALPDVLLFPELCRALELSFDELFGIAPDNRRDSTVNDWRWIGGLNEKARTYAVSEAALRMFSRTGESLPQDGIYCSISPDDFLVADTDGMCFALAGNKVRQKIMNLDAEKTARFFEVLTNPAVIHILNCLSIGSRVDQDDLAERSGMNREEVRSCLLDLMERNIVGWEQDGAGKSGLCLSSGSAAIFMAMAGLAVTGYSGNLAGCFSWFSRLGEIDRF
ncbi:MAG: helix-turn-helix transcriptional regulator [Clostridia bacterium]|nr:helix-turn-helix transcriptional regulator [Clostridia bacterium]